MRGANAGIPQRGGGMTFDEIAAELGVSRQRVHQIYRSGMRKLAKHHPTFLLMLGELMDERQAEADRRVSISAKRHAQPGNTDRLDRAVNLLENESERAA
jgi:hypothetical protein